MSVINVNYFIMVRKDISYWYNCINKRAIGENVITRITLFNSHCCANQDFRPSLVKTKDKGAEVSHYESIHPGVRAVQNQAGAKQNCAVMRCWTTCGAEMCLCVCLVSRNTFLGVKESHKVLYGIAANLKYGLVLACLPACDTKPICWL